MTEIIFVDPRMSFGNANASAASWIAMCAAENRRFNAIVSVAGIMRIVPKMNGNLNNVCRRMSGTPRQLVYEKVFETSVCKMKQKTHDPQWMNTYCSNNKNLKGRDKKGCCKTMQDRCYADCDGRPDSPKAISACKHRCIKANNICKDSK